ncbi:MAG TPA: transcription antitermination factor NusB [Rhodospirillaceae bacterium]|nr:transcription antitermination factor NusB [Rhodospirillaceae bacterium]
MTGKTARERSSARLAAVQALYLMDMTGAPVDKVLDDFLHHGLGGEPEAEERLAIPDPLLFTDILRGAVERGQDLDAMVGQALSGDWSVERLENILRAILRAGAYELTARPDVPMKVVISEYVDLAYAFYSGPEPGLVNAVLDRIGKVVRDVSQP